MGAGIALRGDFETADLWRLAKASKDAGQSRRLLALSGIYYGGRRSDAAWIGGVGLQVILHAKALPGDPYDGHTLNEVLAETEAPTGREIERAYLEKGNRGHDAPKPNRVYRSGQKRGVFGQIRRELRRRSAIEAVIGHCKTDGHLGRNFLKGRLGDPIHAVMSAVGYNLRLILRWFRDLLRKIIAAILLAITPFSTLKPAS